MRRTLVASKGFHAPRSSGGAHPVEPPPSAPPASSPATVTQSASSAASSASASKTRESSLQHQQARTTTSATAAPSSAGRKSTAKNGASAATVPPLSGGSSQAPSPSSKSARPNTVSAMLASRGGLSGHFSANHLRRGSRRDDVGIADTQAQKPVTAIPRSTEATFPASATTTATTTNAAEARLQEAESRKRSRSPSTGTPPFMDNAQHRSRLSEASERGGSDRQPSHTRQATRVNSHAAAHVPRTVFYPPPAELAMPTAESLGGTSRAASEGPSVALGGHSTMTRTATSAFNDAPTSVSLQNRQQSSSEDNIPLAELFAAQSSKPFTSPTDDLPLSHLYPASSAADPVTPNTQPSADGLSPAGSGTAPSSTTASQPGTRFLSALEHQQQQQQQQQAVTAPLGLETPPAFLFSTPATPSLGGESPQPYAALHSQPPPVSHALTFSQASSSHYSPTVSAVATAEGVPLLHDSPPLPVPPPLPPQHEQEVCEAVCHMQPSLFVNAATAQFPPSTPPRSSLPNPAVAETTHSFLSVPHPAVGEEDAPESAEALEREMAEDMRLSMDLPFTPSATGSGAPPVLSQSSHVMDEGGEEGEGEDEERVVEGSGAAVAGLCGPSSAMSEPADGCPSGGGGRESPHTTMPTSGSEAQLMVNAVSAPNPSSITLSTTTSAANTAAADTAPPQSPASWPIHEAPLPYIPTPSILGAAPSRVDSLPFAAVMTGTAVAAATAANSNSRHRTVFSFSSRKPGEEGSHSSAPAAPPESPQVQPIVLGAAVDPNEESERSFLFPPPYVSQHTPVSREREMTPQTAVRDGAEAMAVEPCGAEHTHSVTEPSPSPLCDGGQPSPSVSSSHHPQHEAPPTPTPTGAAAAAASAAPSAEREPSMDGYVSALQLMFSEPQLPMSPAEAPPPPPPAAAPASAPCAATPPLPSLASAGFPASTSPARPGRTCFTLRSAPPAAAAVAVSTPASDPAPPPPSHANPEGNNGYERRELSAGPADPVSAHHRGGADGAEQLVEAREAVSPPSSLPCGNDEEAAPRPVVADFSALSAAIERSMGAVRVAAAGTPPPPVHAAAGEGRSAEYSPQRHEDSSSRAPAGTVQGDASATDEERTASLTACGVPPLPVTSTPAAGNLPNTRSVQHENEEEDGATPSVHTAVVSAAVGTAAHAAPSAPLPQSSVHDTFYDLPLSVGAFYASRRGVQRLYDWQHELLMEPDVRRGRNFIYSLPTSGGKTLVAELSLLRCVLNRRQSCFFVLPFVSLAEEKTMALQPLTSTFDFSVDGHYGSSGRFPLCEAPAIYVCTIEKANSLLNYMLEEGRTAEIGAVVVDELHMVGESRRGATLELFLSKLLMIDQARQRQRAAEAAAAVQSRPQGVPEQKERERGEMGDDDEEEYYPDDLKAYDVTRAPATQYRDPGPLQIIGMSATVPNLQTIADWLCAACFERDFRPVPLHAFSVVGGMVLRDGQVNERNLSGGSVNQHLLELATEVPEASVLVFCASRQQCVDTARGIVHYLRTQAISGQQLPEAPNTAGGAARTTAATAAAVASQGSAAMKSLVADLLALSHYEASQLSEIVPYGVAFHHGGLLAEERDLIELAFRRKHIRILCSTSTLAAGVNLPARRVIIKTPYVGRDFLTKSRYLQMCGRAGRAGLDPYGESFLLLTRRDQSRGHALMHSSVEPCCSQILEDDQTLTRSLLECIGVGLVTDSASSRQWSASLLSRHAVGPVDAAWRKLLATVTPPPSPDAVAVASAADAPSHGATSHSEESRLNNGAGGAVVVPPPPPSPQRVPPQPGPLTAVPLAALEAMVRSSLDTLARCGLVAVSQVVAAADGAQTTANANTNINNNEEDEEEEGSAALADPDASSPVLAPVAAPELQVRVTPFGSSSVRSCFSVEEALLLREELEELRLTGLILSDDLHLCYFLTPLREVGDCDWELLRLMMSRMSDSRQRIASLLGVDAYFINQQAMGLGGPLQVTEEGRRRLFTAKRFFVALMLADVLAEVPMPEVEQRYNVNRGQLQNLMRSASMFSSSITSFCHAMEWYSLEAVLSSFVKRLGFGVKPDLLPLMEIRGMQPPRARALWNAGFKKLSTIAAADADDMVAKVKSMNPPDSKSAKFFTKRSALMVIREATLTLQTQIQEKKGELQELTVRGGPPKT